MVNKLPPLNSFLQEFVDFIRIHGFLKNKTNANENLKEKRVPESSIQVQDPEISTVSVPDQHSAFIILFSIVSPPAFSCAHWDLSVATYEGDLAVPSACHCIHNHKIAFIAILLFYVTSIIFIFLKSRLFETELFCFCVNNVLS